MYFFVFCLLRGLELCISLYFFVFCLLRGLELCISLYFVCFRTLGDLGALRSQGHYISLLNFNCLNSYPCGLYPCTGVGIERPLIPMVW